MNIKQIATIKVAKDQFANIRPWKWWIEDETRIIHWGGDEWTATEAQAAGIEAISKIFPA